MVRSARSHLAATSATAAREFNGSIWFPDTHPLTKAYLDWVKRLDAASKGELKAKIFTGTALLPPNAHLSGLKDGIAQRHLSCRHVYADRSA